MNMTLSKRGDYVMRSAISLARAFDSGRPRKIREVVADTELPRTFASQILADLVRAGLAVSKAGRDGGYRLARPPEKISVLEVVEAAEGPLRAERCALGDGPCRWESVCPLHETWVAATARLNSLLAETKLAEIAARDAAIEAGLYEPPADSHRSPAVTLAVDDAVHVELGARAVAGALTRSAIDEAWLVAAAVETAVLTGGAHANPLDRSDQAPEVTEWTLDRLGRAAADGAARYALGWRLDGTGGTCRCEGELSVHAVDDERCEIRLAGSWHQHVPGGASRAGVLEEAAQRTVRRFLRQVARHLEERPVEAAVAAEPAGAAGAGAGAATVAAPGAATPRRRSTAPTRQPRRTSRLA